MNTLLNKNLKAFLALICFTLLLNSVFCTQIDADLTNPSDLGGRVTASGRQSSSHGGGPPQIDRAINEELGLWRIFANLPGEVQMAVLNEFGQTPENYDSLTDKAQSEILLALDNLGPLRDGVLTYQRVVWNNETFSISECQTACKNSANFLNYSDPFMAYNAFFTNPNDEDMTIDFTSASNIDRMDESMRWEALANVRVFDTGGDVGATASFTQVFSVNGEPGGFSTGLSDSFNFTTTEAGPSSERIHEFVEPNTLTGGATEMFTQYSVSISPGDTVSIVGYFNIASESAALFNSNGITPSLNRFSSASFQAVPEPSSLGFLALAGVIFCRRRSRRSCH